MRVSIGTVQFVAITLTVLVLVPSGAHLLEFANKTKLDAESYMIVQQIYFGWALAGIPLFGAIAANLWLAWRSRSQRIPFALASIAFFLVTATLISFLIWIYPANVATAQWTRTPANLEPLRKQWEMTHALNAAATLAAALAAVGSSLSWRQKPAD